jgi:hypothetical protein
VTSPKATLLPNLFVRPSSLKTGSADKIDMPFLVRGVYPRRRRMSFVGLVRFGTNQGKQKCLMYATNFALSASEEFGHHKTAHLRTNPLARKRSGFKIMTNACNIR